MASRAIMQSLRPGEIIGESKVSLKAKPKKKRSEGFVFLDLPPEIWSYICELILLSPQPIKCFSKLGYQTNARIVMQPGISRTCRLLREHCLPRFYEENTFVVYDQIAMPHQLVTWLSAIGTSNRTMLKRLLLWHPPQNSREKITEYCRNAGIEDVTWRRHGDDPEDKWIVTQMVFPGMEENPADEERLQRDVEFLRHPPKAELSPLEAMGY